MKPNNNSLPYQKTSFFCRQKYFQKLLQKVLTSIPVGYIIRVSKQSEVRDMTLKELKAAELEIWKQDVARESLKKMSELAVGRLMIHGMYKADAEREVEKLIAHYMNNAGYRRPDAIRAAHDEIMEIDKHADMLDMLHN